MSVFLKKKILNTSRLPFTDFYNPQDPDDHSWEPHPTDYPWVELQYPNTYASEKSVFLFLGTLGH
jgi:hypothetical protein